MKSDPAPVLRIFVTPGEPAGVGPELLARIAHRAQPCELVALCDPELLQRAAHQIGLPTLTLRTFQPGIPPEPHRPGTLILSPIPLPLMPAFGRSEPGNAGYVLEGLAMACKLLLAGHGAALVTGPVHKETINAAGIPFTGHTEFLAEHTGGALPVMMLAAGTLRVALATTHLPLKDVPAAITVQRLTKVLQILHGDLQGRYGFQPPRITVCGLNPHAGEGGYLGREEIEIITPVLARLRAEGMQLTGPVPADTAFLPEGLAAADAFLAMYHDQGLPVLKHHGFERAVNITLGLPIFRTSVDHGTALKIAGLGRASAGSFQAAIEEAVRGVRMMAQGGRDGT